jgi:deoxyribose-phosphate aldolase
MQLNEKISQWLSLAKTYEQALPTAPASDRLSMPSSLELAAMIDHTLLKPEATAAQVETLCQEAIMNGFASACIQPVYVPLVASLLQGYDVKVCTVIGFPLGSNLSQSKIDEASRCIQEGAVELDMVLWVGGMKNQAYAQVYEEIAGVTELAHENNVLLKVILETSSLTQIEKIMACLICKDVGVDFVKTSTGFASGGATVQDVDLMHRVVGPQVRVKASGGIRSLKDVLSMIQAGASRLGTSSGVRIMDEAKKSQGNP